MRRTDLRVTSHPYLKFRRGRELTINFRGRNIKAHEGETVGAALYASGLKVFSRSFKFHRPRGLLCVSGKCPNCMMTVNCKPNVRVCICPVQDHMQVESQNAWPSLEHDFMSILDHLDFLFPAGFQYRRFIRPAFMWPLIERIIRRTAGLGRVSDRTADAREAEDVKPDVLVVGAGPSGLSAAVECSRLGAKVMLIEDSSRLGGRLALQTAQFHQHGKARGFELAEKMADEVLGSSNVAVHTDSTVFGYYQEGLFAAETPDKLLTIRPRQVIVATGCNDVPSLFVNNDLPGIFLPIGLQRLMHQYGIQPGERVVVATTNDFGYELAQNLLDIGAGEVTVADERENSGSSPPEGVRQIAGCMVEEASGRKCISKVKIRSRNGREEWVKCDLLCCANEVAPSNELLFQIGCEMHFSHQAGGYIPVRDSKMRVKEGCYAVGAAAGSLSLTEAVDEGKVAAVSACNSIGIGKGVT